MKMNPQMFEQARRNMNPDTMKMASEQISGMSDEQLNNFSKMTGNIYHL